MPPILNSVTQFVADTIPSPYGLFKVVTGLLAASSALVPGDDFKKVPVATHGWEIKLGINENALKGGRPTHELMHAFSLEDTPDTRAYSYYDNDGHELNKAGWAIRLRHKDGKDFEMTYKKRYTVKDSVEEALKLARDEGFDKSDKNYDAEVDWTYSKKTLSFTLKKEYPADGYHGTTMPDDDTGRHWLLEMMPGKLHDWSKKHWGDKVMGTTRQHGPVTSNVWKGKWAGTEVKLEVLPVKNAEANGTETIVELSFGAETEKEATSLRDKAMSQMKSAGWLLTHDVLKTRIVLDRY